MTARTLENAALSELERGAWKGMLRVHAQLVKALDCQLESTHDLPLTHFDVLCHVAATEHRRMRMCDLADEILLSRSGLTRLVDRMVKDGLLERCACEIDARGAFACLTPAGEQRLAAAQLTYRAAARALFLRHFEDGHLAELAVLWERVPPAEGIPCADRDRPRDAA